MPNYVKRQSAHLPGVTTSCSMVDSATPDPTCSHVHLPWVLIFAQETDGLAVLPGDGIQVSWAPKFVANTFDQLLPNFLG